MPVFRVSLFSANTNTRVGGWTENWWNNADSHNTAKTRGTALALLLNNFRGYGPVINKIRVSQYGLRRSGRSYPLNIPNTPPPGTEQYADYPTTKVQLELTGTSVSPVRTTQWLGGIVDGAIVNGGFWVPTPNANTTFQSVRAALISGANGWSINVLDPANTPKTVTSVAGTTGLVTTGVNHGFANNDFVRLMRIQGIPEINGIWQISDVDATTFRLIGWQTTTAVMTRSNAVAVKQAHVPLGIIDAQIVQATSHRVGKPSGLLGGRRRRPGISLVGPLVHA